MTKFNIHCSILIIVSLWTHTNLVATSKNPQRARNGLPHQKYYKNLIFYFYFAPTIQFISAIYQTDSNSVSSYLYLAGAKNLLSSIIISQTNNPSMVNKFISFCSFVTTCHLLETVQRKTYWLYINNMITMHLN